jgi:hypothetical protein
MIGFSLRIQQRMAFECRVCRQLIDDDRVWSTVVSAMLFGFAPYAVCPSCFQEPTDRNDRNYRRRFRKYISKPFRVPSLIDGERIVSPCGRVFKIKDGTHTPPRFKGDHVMVGTVWPVEYEGEHAGSIWLDLMYDRESPTFHASATQLLWRFASDAPNGVGFDVDMCKTREEVIDRWARRADEILDWNEGRPVSVWPSGRARRVRCGGTVSVFNTFGNGHTQARCNRCNLVSYNAADGSRCPLFKTEQVTS